MNKKYFVHTYFQKRNYYYKIKFPGNVKIDVSSDKVDSHADKMSDNSGGNQSSNKPIALSTEGDNKEEVSQQNE